MKDIGEKLQNELMEIGKKIYSQNSPQEDKPKESGDNDSVIDADFSETK